MTILISMFAASKRWKAASKKPSRKSHAMLGSIGRGFAPRCAKRGGITWRLIRGCEHFVRCYVARLGLKSCHDVLGLQRTPERRHFAPGVPSNLFVRSRQQSA